VLLPPVPAPAKTAVITGAGSLLSRVGNPFVASYVISA
jgi:hypothetical protein